MRRTAVTVAVASLFAAGAAWADDDDGRYRNPQGSVAVSGFFGIGAGSQGTTFAVGLGVGYAVLTGVVPGVRALFITGRTTGGEVAGTLTLTPPLEGSVTPFVLGEAGRRWGQGPDAYVYGAGAGVYIGDPQARFGVQLGWIFRWLSYDDGFRITAHSPLVAISVRF